MDNDPAFLRHYIGVLHREACARRDTAFHATLLVWISNARKRLASAKASARPAQGDLFAGSLQ